MNSHEAWEKQKNILEYYRKNNPELIECKNRRKEEDVFKEIGIWNIPQNRQEGYIRRFFYDFLVEEKTQNNRVIKINEINNSAEGEYKENNKTLFASMIKIGLTTTTATDRVAKLLNLKSNIGFAGLKDEEAITAQEIALHKVNSTPDEISKIKIPGVILTNFRFGDKTLRPGYLEGNVFSIAVRTKEKVDLNILNARLKTIESYGILNYYQSQRFGGIRLDSHKIGKLILQGKYDTAVKFLLFNTNDFEMPLIAKLKKEGEPEYPDIDKIIKIFNELPYSFYQELRVLNYLKDNKDDYVGALREIKESITICIYSYASLLFNKHLSIYSKKNGCLNEEFPLLLSNDRQDHEIYKDFLEEDETTYFLKNIYPLKFIYLAKRSVAGRVFPKDIKFKEFDGGVVIKFFLKKGSYATTFLSNLFKINEGAPIPDWVKETEIDPKALLGEGNLDELKKLFKDYWNVKIIS